MDRITPWVSVEPLRTPRAILGPLPMVPGVATTFAIPLTVVPAHAAGILVFAWASIAGVNVGGVSFWHLAVNVAAGRQNFFSLLVEGRAQAGASCVNSQAFWLPMPPDAKLQVTLFGAELPSPHNHGEVEIHGYYPAAG
jgi:hypothetical protein